MGAVKRQRAQLVSLCQGHQVRDLLEKNGSFSIASSALFQGRRQSIVQNRHRANWCCPCKPVVRPTQPADVTEVL